MELSIRDYAKKVQEMREAQREYFKARRLSLPAVAESLLVKSRAEERAVDIITQDILATSKPGTLFP